MHQLHSVLALQHGISQREDVGIEVRVTTCEDGGVNQLGLVGMDKEVTFLAKHEEVRTLGRLVRQYLLRKPLQREVGGDDSDKFVVGIEKRLAVGRNHLLLIHVVEIEVEERIHPARLPAVLRLRVPVHVEIAIVVLALLLHLDGVGCMTRIDGIILALLSKVVRLEGDGTSIKARIKFDDASGVGHHRVGIQMRAHQPICAVGGNLHFVQNLCDAQSRVVQHLGSPLHGIFAHVVSRFEIHEAQRKDEGQDRKAEHPERNSQGERMPYFRDWIVHFAEFSSFDNVALLPFLFAALALSVHAALAPF